jgi:hypothetical protein
MSKVEEKLYSQALCNAVYNSDLQLKTIEYDPHDNPNSQRAIDQALVEGLEVVFPEPNQLQIDIDNEHSHLLLQNQLLIVEKFVGHSNCEAKPSKSGNPHKWHVTLTFDRTFTPLERIGLQAMLGSDRVRELLSFVQMENEDPHPTLFLEKTAPKQLAAASEPLQLTEGTNIDEVA